MSRVVQVAMTVTLDSGDMHTVVVRDPEPTGDNPRFLSMQMRDGVESLTARLDKVLTAYSEQVRE